MQKQDLFMLVHTQVWHKYTCKFVEKYFMDIHTYWLLLHSPEMGLYLNGKYIYFNFLTSRFKILYIHSWQVILYILICINSTDHM